MEKEKENTKHMAYEQCYDAILKHYGPVDAVVFGLILNKSKLSGGCCQYSEVQIGNYIHTSWKTVSMSIDRLLVNGLIVVESHFEKTSKLNKTKWYKPADDLYKKLKELSDSEPEPIKSNIGRVKDQEFHKNKLHDTKSISKIELSKNADDTKSISKSEQMIQKVSGNDDLMIQKVSYDRYKNYPNKELKQELNKQESTINTFSKTGKASGFIESEKETWETIIREHFNNENLTEMTLGLIGLINRKNININRYKDVLPLLPENQSSLLNQSFRHNLNNKLDNLII